MQWTSSESESKSKSKSKSFVDPGLRLTYPRASTGQIMLKLEKVMMGRDSSPLHWTRRVGSGPVRSGRVGSRYQNSLCVSPYLAFCSGFTSTSRAGSRRARNTCLVTCSTGDPPGEEKGLGHGTLGNGSYPGRTGADVLIRILSPSFGQSKSPRAARSVRRLQRPSRHQARRVLSNEHTPIASTSILNGPFLCGRFWFVQCTKPVHGSCCLPQTLRHSCFMHFLALPK